MQKIIYVTISDNDDGQENLLAWTSLQSADEGKVGVYKLVEEIDTRTTTEVRRKGSKKWFKPQ